MPRSHSLFSSGAFAFEPVLTLNTPIAGLTGDGLGCIWVIILGSISGNTLIEATVRTHSFTGLAASVATSLGMHIGIHAELVAAILFG
jgi:hypothetical protein